MFITRSRLIRKLAVQQQAMADLARIITGGQRITPPPAPVAVPDVRYVELGKEKYKLRGTVTYHDKTTKILQFHVGSLEDATRKLNTEFKRLPDRELVYSIHIFMDRIY